VKWDLSCPKNCFNEYEQLTIQCPDGVVRTVKFCPGCKYQEFYVLGYIAALEERVRRLEEQVKELSAALAGKPVER